MLLIVTWINLTKIVLQLHSLNTFVHVILFSLERYVENTPAIEEDMVDF